MAYMAYMAYSLDSSVDQVLSDVIQRIDRINYELEHDEELDALIEKDIRLLLRKHSNKLPESQQVAYFEGFKNRHMPALRLKKIEALERAKERLEHIKGELEEL